jgi:hypothetical protein
MEQKKIICDTDVMIDFFDAKNSRHTITSTIIAKKVGEDNIVLSAITKMELVLGATIKRI